MRLFPPDGTPHLEPDAFFDVFDSAWERLAHRFLKIERLQSYHEPADPSYQAFIRGDLEAADRLLAARIAEQQPLYDAARRAGVDVVRLRILELPLSPYLKYEFLGYHHSLKFGERIHVVRSDAVRDLLLRTKISDCLFFDDSLLMIHDYDAQGAFVGGWHVTDSNLIRRDYLPIANQLIAASVPFDVFETAHSDTDA